MNKKQILVVVSGILVLGIVAVNAYQHDFIKSARIPTGISSETETKIEAPLPVFVDTLTLEECTLDVSNYRSDGSRSYGQGVVVQYEDETFVLTSTMIFTHGGDITVGTGRFIFTATISHRDDELGLVALKCDLRKGTSSANITEFPSIPPGVLVQAGENEVNTLEYMNDYWVILDGSFPADVTGLPVSQNGELVGIIVGLNRANMKQAIMVSNRGIREFVDELTRPDPPAYGYEDEDEDLPFGGFFRRVFGG